MMSLREADHAKKKSYIILLSADEARELSRRACKYTLPYFEVIRAKMILLAARDWQR